MTSGNRFNSGEARFGSNVPLSAASVVVAIGAAGAAGALIVVLASGDPDAPGRLLSLGGLAALLVIIGTWVSRRVAAEAGERRFLQQLFLAAYALRILFALAFFYGAPALIHDHPYLSQAFLNDDGVAMDRAAMGVVDSLRQGNPLSLSAVPIPGSRGYILLTAAIYAVFGYQPLAVRFVDSFLGALIPVFTYGLAASLLSMRWARVAALLVAFYPEQIIYSSVQLKEIPLGLAMIVFLWALWRWLSERGILKIVVMAACLAYVLLTRFYYAFPLLAAVPVALLYPPRGQRTRLRRWITGAVLLVLLFFIAESILNPFLGISLRDPFSSGRQSYFILGEQQIAADSFYQVFSGRSGLTRLAAVPLIVAFTMLNPFLLWPLLDPDPVYTLLSPAIVLWYLLMPFVVFSLVSRALVREWRPLVTVVVVALLLLAISGGGAVATGRLKVPLQSLLLIGAADGLRRFLTGDYRIRLWLVAYGTLGLAVVMLYLFAREPVIFYSGFAALAVTLSVMTLRWLASRQAKPV